MGSGFQHQHSSGKEHAEHVSFMLRAWNMEVKSELRGTEAKMLPEAQREMVREDVILLDT